MGVAADYCRVEYDRIGDYSRQHQRMLRPGTQLCVILSRGVLDERAKDLARQAIAMGIPTYLIADERGRPRALRPDGGALA